MDVSRLADWPMVAAGLAVFASVTMLLTGCASSPTEGDRYEQRCHDKGGIVSLVEASAWVSVYKCAGDKGELLPRLGGQ